MPVQRACVREFACLRELACASLRLRDEPACAGAARRACLCKLACAECGACGLPVQRACVRELACSSLLELAPAWRACKRKPSATPLPARRAYLVKLACSSLRLRDEPACTILPVLRDA